MKNYDQQHVKNIAVVGSSKSGKTTFIESMIYESGHTTRRGTVEEGSTVTDFHEYEKERGNSVFASPTYVVWRDHKLNIVDTPGNDNYIGETIGALRVTETCVLMLNAHNGVEVGTELNWRQVKKRNMPTVMVVNQLDHENANFDTTLDQCQAQLAKNIVVIQYPYNPGPDFDSIIDVLKMVMYKFPAEGGKPKKLAIPEDQKEKADELHNALVEAAAENDESLMELYFEKGELDEKEMRKGLQLGVKSGSMFPLFCCCAKKNMGTGRIMGFIGNVCPTTNDVKPEEDVNGNQIDCDPNGSPCIFVYKTSIEPHLGIVNYFKVISGKITAGMDLVDSRTGNSERLGQLNITQGKKKESVDQLLAGDLGAAVKLKDVGSNDTLSEKGKEIAIKPISFPPFRIEEAIHTKDKKDEEKLGEALSALEKEDSTLHAAYNGELKQIIMKGQGELHLAVAAWKLEKEHSIQIDFGRPRIPYRETIQGSAKADYRHKKQSGGSGQFGEVYIQVDAYYEDMPDPEGFNVRKKDLIELEWGGKLAFLNCIVGGAIDTRYIPAVQKGVMETMTIGPLTGSYVRDVRVALYDGKMHPVDSNEISFKIAGSHAFKTAFESAKPKLLEPIYEVEVLTPEEVMGDVMTDLQSRRAIIMGVDSEGSFQKIKAKVPLAELYRYSTSLRSISQGRATHTREFADYALVPEEVKVQLIQEFKAEEVLA